MDLTLVFEDIEVPPNQILRVIVAERFPLVVRAAVRLPQLRSFLNMKSDQSAFRIKTA